MSYSLLLFESKQWAWPQEHTEKHHTIFRTRASAPRKSAFSSDHFLFSRLFYPLNHCLNTLGFLIRSKNIFLHLFFYPIFVFVCMCVCTFMGRAEFSLGCYSSGIVHLVFLSSLSQGLWANWLDQAAGLGLGALFLQHATIPGFLGC